jgi:exodeoxyribonuclease III
MRAKEFVPVLREKSWDVLVIPEFRCSWEKFLKIGKVGELLKEHGWLYHVLHLTKDNIGHAGVLVLSKRKPVKTGVGLGVEELDKEGRVAWMEFESRTLVGVYAPSSGQPGILQRLQKRVAWDAAFKKFLKTGISQKKPYVVCGDLNVASREEDAAAHYWATPQFPSLTKEERDAHSALLEELDLIDIHIHSGVGPQSFTWWRHVWDKKTHKGMRLDYVLAEKSLVERGQVSHYRIAREVQGSDHAPIEFKVWLDKPNTNNTPTLEPPTKQGRQYLDFLLRDSHDSTEESEDEERPDNRHPPNSLYSVLKTDEEARDPLGEGHPQLETLALVEKERTDELQELRESRVAGSPRWEDKFDSTSEEEKLVSALRASTVMGGKEAEERTDLRVALETAALPQQAEAPVEPGSTAEISERAGDTVHEGSSHSEGSSDQLFSIGSWGTEDSVIPCLDIVVGGTPCEAMADSGSFSSLVDRKWAETVCGGTKIDTKGRKPAFRTASRERILPVGRMDLVFEVGGVRFTQQVWVLEGLACDVILGGSFLKKHRVDILYSKQKMVLDNLEGYTCSVPFKQEAALAAAIIRHECNLLSQSTITLKPLHETLLKVSTSKGFDFGVPVPFGRIWTSPLNTSTICARGITDLRKGETSVRVLNPFKDREVTVTKGSPVAFFRMDDEDKYDAYMVDLEQLGKGTKEHAMEELAASVLRAREKEKNGLGQEMSEWEDMDFEMTGSEEDFEITRDWEDMKFDLTGPDDTLEPEKDRKYGVRRGTRGGLEVYQEADSTPNLEKECTRLEVSGNTMNLGALDRTKQRSVGSRSNLNQQPRSLAHSSTCTRTTTQPLQTTRALSIGTPTVDTSISMVTSIGTRTEIAPQHASPCPQGKHAVTLPTPEGTSQVSRDQGIARQDDRHEPYDKSGVPSVDLPDFTPHQVEAMSDEEVERHFSLAPLKNISFEGSELDARGVLAMKRKLLEHRQVFSINDKNPGVAKAPPFRIETDGCRPQAVGSRPVRPDLRKVVREHIDRMLEYNIIEPSNSPWAAAVVLTPKKNGSIRFCTDYRLLNKHTVRSQYPLTRIDDTLSSLHGTKYFTTVDATAGFHQIPVHEADREKTAFRTPHGLWQYKKMPFGLTNAPAAYQAFMDHVLTNIKWEIALCFIDDICIFSPTWEKHLEDIDTVFTALKSYDIHLTARKCKFAMSSVEFLGHMISRGGISPCDNKVDSITNANPSSKDECRAWHGLASYYRKFVKNFAARVLPLTAFINSKQKFPKDGAEGLPSDVKAAIADIKRCLSTPPILLEHPDFDKPFTVHTDASGKALGATLCQEVDGEERVVMYISRALRAHEKGYLIHEAEGLAVVWALGVFRPYIIGKPLTVVTDNQALLSLFKKKQTSRLLRWVLALQEYDITWEHRVSSKHGDADGLTRMNKNRSERSFGEGFEPEALALQVDDQPLFGLGAVRGMKSEGMPKYGPELLAMLSSSTAYTSEPVGEELPSFVCAEEESAEVTKLPGLSELVAEQRNDPSFSHIISILLEKGELRDAESREPLAPNRSLRKGKRVMVDGYGLATVITRNGNGSFAVRYDDGSIFSAVKAEKLKAYEPKGPETKIVHEGGGKTKFFLNPGGVLMRSSAIPLRVEGTVGRTSPEGQKSQQRVEQICVPHKFRRSVLHSCHGLPMAGHDGMKRTKLRVREKFYWPKYQADVSAWVRGCLFCQKRKHPRPHCHGLTHPMLASRPWELVAFDLVGPLPETEKHGYKYLLTAIDIFSRYPFAIPVTNKSIKTVVDALHKYLITVFGPPRLLLSDREKSFVAAVVKGLYSKMGITKIATTGYQPTGNGSVERFHRWLNCTMTMFVNSKKNNWDEHIDSLLFAYRTSVCESTGLSPWEVVMGRKPVMPSDIQYAIDPVQLSEEAKRNMCTSESMRDAYRFVWDRQTKIAMRNKERRDKKQEHTEFLDGDPVMCYDYIHDPGPDAPKGVRKLKYRFSGPHTIANKDDVSDLHYHVKDRNTGSVRKVHVNRLRLYYPVPEDLRPACGEEAREEDIEPSQVEIDAGDSIIEGGKPKVGDMVVIGCEPDEIEKIPWAVAKVMARNEQGGMTVWWYGNNYGRLTSAWRRGYYQTSDQRRYYKEKKDHRSHLPYTSEVSNSPIYDDHVIVHGFQLTQEDKVPISVLTKISACPDVAWEIPQL